LFHRPSLTLARQWTFKHYASHSARRA
jgi:hypothetical protein